MRLMAIDQPLRDPKIPLVIQPGDNPHIRVQMISNCMLGSVWYPKKAPVSLGKSQNCMGTMGRRLADDWRMIVPPKMVGQKTEVIFWDSIKLMQSIFGSGFHIIPSGNVARIPMERGNIFSLLSSGLVNGIS